MLSFLNYGVDSPAYYMRCRQEIIPSPENYDEIRQQEGCRSEMNTLIHNYLQGECAERVKRVPFFCIAYISQMRHSIKLLLLDHGICWNQQRGLKICLKLSDDNNFGRNIKALIPGFKLISCLLQLLPFPDVMERLFHISEVLTASSGSPISLADPISQGALYLFLNLNSNLNMFRLDIRKKFSGTGISCPGR